MRMKIKMSKMAITQTILELNHPDFTSFWIYIVPYNNDDKMMMTRMIMMMMMEHLPRIYYSCRQYSLKKKEEWECHKCGKCRHLHPKVEEYSFIL